MLESGWTSAPSASTPSWQAEGPPEDDTCFTGGMRDTILNNAPSTSLGSLTATSAVASLGEVVGWLRAEVELKCEDPKVGRSW